MIPLNLCDGKGNELLAESLATALFDLLIMRTTDLCKKFVMRCLSLQVHCILGEINTEWNRENQFFTYPSLTHKLKLGDKHDKQKSNGQNLLP
jgi:hypothetical protein